LEPPSTMLWRAGRPPRGGVRKACGEPPGRNQREQSRAMNRSAEDGEWWSARSGGDGTWVPPRRTKVRADDTVGKSVSDPGRPGIVHREGMAGIVRHSQTKGRETGNAKPGLKPPMVGADISASEIPTEAVPGVGSGRGTQERGQSKRPRIAAGRAATPGGNGVRAKGPGSPPDERRRRSDPKGRPEGEGPVLCGSVDARRAGEYMAEVRTSSQSESPCAGIEEPRKPPGDAGGSSSPVNGDDHTGKRLAGKPHEPFERADGGRATARPPPTLQQRTATRRQPLSATLSSAWQRTSAPSPSSRTAACATSRVSATSACRASPLASC